MKKKKIKREGGGKERGKEGGKQRYLRIKIYD